MNELALCAGIGGLSLGLQRAGVKTACYVERNRYRVSVLTARFRDGDLDHAPIWDDVTTFDGKPWCGCVDIISAGFPCQPFSHSGLRKAETDERYIWPDIYGNICVVRPRYIVLENVSGFLMADRQRPAPVSAVLADLASIGFDAEWQTLPASVYGAPHERKRAFVVGYTNQGGRGRVLRSLARIGFETYTGWPTNHMDTPGGYLQAMEERTREPAIFRGNDGTAYRVDRLEAIGEAVVPQIAEYVGQCIMKNEQEAA